MTSNHSESGKYFYLRDIPTEELEGLLQQEFIMNEEKEPDTDYITAIMEVIMSREQKDPETRKQIADAAWKDFQENYHGQSAAYEPVPIPESKSSTIHQVEPVPKRKSYHWIRNVLLVATAIFVLGGIVSATGWFQAIITWTSETFGFVSPRYEENPEVLSDDPYADLRSIVADHTDLAVVPHWAPEGTMTETSVRAVDRKEMTLVEGPFICDSGSYTIWYRIHDVQFGKHQTEYEQSDNYTFYTHNGIEYCITNNNSFYSAAWENDNVEGMIQGELSYEDLIKMVDSISEE